MMMHQTKSIRLAICAVAVLFGLSACGTSAVSESGNASAETGEPAFSGSYAKELERAYERAKTDLGKGVLRDGKVNDAELAELNDAYNECLAPYGLQANADGSTVTQLRGNLSTDEYQKVSQECGDGTDWDTVQGIWSMMDANPDNLDAEAMARETYRCFKRHGFLDGVANPLTEDEYAALTGGSETQRSPEELMADADRKSQFEQQFEPDNIKDAERYQLWYDCLVDPLNQ